MIERHPTMAGGSNTYSSHQDPTQQHVSSPLSLHSFQMDDSMVSRPAASIDGTPQPPLRRRGNRMGVARHTFGLILLLCVVFLWTSSSFLSSNIFANNNYAKPFFVTYINTFPFILVMVPTTIKEMYLRYRSGTLRATLGQIFSIRTLRSFWTNEDYTIIEQQGEGHETEAFLKPDEILPTTSSNPQEQRYMADVPVIESSSKHLGLIPTARLSLAFCLLWFGANYLAVACLQYTTVASSTILAATSSVWTLLIGAITRTEKFTWRKLCGVLASIGGVILISQVDLSLPATDESTPDDSNPIRLLLRATDTFPQKSVGEVALGDALALLAAIFYGIYTIRLKQSTLQASPLSINMPLFFSLVGLFIVIIFLPLFPLLHFTGVETFELPPSPRVWVVLLSISLSSFLSDLLWAYSMVLTSPLVVTVGLSLTIPLSLVGEMIIQGRYEGWVYWVGAMVVVGSFVFVEREEVKEEEGGSGGLEGGLVGTGLEGQGQGDLLDSEDDEDDRRRDRLQHQAHGYVDVDEVS